MDRYDAEVVGGEPCMVPSETGGWVLYEDAILAIQAEREACAIIAEQYEEGFGGAAAIRSRR